MKIVYITTSLTGGAGIAALRLYTTIQNIKEVESHLIQKADTIDELKKLNISTLYEKETLFYRLKRKLGLTPEKRQSKLLPTYSPTNSYEIATFPISSYRIEDHPLVKEADIIHLHWVANFLNYPSFFEKIKKPIVWTLHDMNAFQGVFHYQNDIQNNLHLLELENCINKNKTTYISQHKNIHIVTPSQWLGKISQASQTFKNFKHYVIPYGIQIDKSITNITQSEAKTYLSIDNNYPILLFVAHGVDIYRKGFDLLVKAIEKIDSHKLNLISIGGDKIKIKEKTNIKHIHLGNIYDREKLNKIYTAADITILPSREDNLPNVMIESLINGTPVMSFLNGGMAEHITTGYNGILVEKIDSETLKIAIEDFLNNKYTFDRNEIRQCAQNTFDENKQALSYISLYEQLLKE